MVYYVLGWLTVVSIAVIACWLTYYMFSVNCDTRTWRRPIAVPRLSTVEAPATTRPNGYSEFVGLV